MKHFLATIFVFLISIGICTIPPIAYAQVGSTLVLTHAPESVAQQQQFYVDVILDTNGESINGIEGTISFSDATLSFVRAETGTSNVTLWIDQPTQVGNTVTFSGVIPGGFDGQIDPFDSGVKGPGQIVRLVFVGKTAGVAQINTIHTRVTLNDGHGTLESVPDTSKIIAVSNTIAPSLYVVADNIPPTLSAQVVSDVNLFDGKYTLLFTASDKQSGIDHVELKEDDGPWTTIESPYLLHNQTKKGILLIRAYDTAGNVTDVHISRVAPFSARVPNSIVLVLILCFILYVIYKKNLRSKKAPHRS